MEVGCVLCKRRLRREGVASTNTTRKKIEMNEIWCRLRPMSRDASYLVDVWGSLWGGKKIQLAIFDRNTPVCFERKIRDGIDHAPPPLIHPVLYERNCFHIPFLDIPTATLSTEVNLRHFTFSLPRILHKIQLLSYIRSPTMVSAMHGRCFVHQNTHCVVNAIPTCGPRMLSPFILAPHRRTHVHPRRHLTITAAAVRCTHFCCNFCNHHCHRLAKQSHPALPPSIIIMNRILMYWSN